MIKSIFTMNMNVHWTILAAQTIIDNIYTCTINALSINTQ